LIIYFILLFVFIFFFSIFFKKKKKKQELSTDIAGFKIPSHGNLEHWAKGGVLLLNAT